MSEKEEEDQIIQMVNYISAKVGCTSAEAYAALADTGYNMEQTLESLMNP